MKVLERKGWPGLKARCKHCQSLVLIESDDVLYSKILGPGETPCWYADCPVCVALVIIKESSLPERIAKGPYEKVVREPYVRKYVPGGKVDMRPMNPHRKDDR